MQPASDPDINTSTYGPCVEIGRMSLFDGLKLVELVKDGEIRTYLANDPQRSRNVLVHWMPASGSNEVHALLEMLDHLPPTARSLILESGVRHDRMYVITENPTKFPGLQEWLSEAAQQKSAEVADPMQRQGQWQAQPAAPQPAPEPTLEVPRPSPPVSAPETGEFTRMFAEKPAAAPAPSVPQKPQEPGEFTRLFAAQQQINLQQPKNSQPTAPPPISAPKPRSNEPGEFTRMFMSTGSAPPSTPLAPSKPASSEPGEFTRMFQGQPQPGAGQPPQRQKTEPGEFTKFFQSPLATPSAATPSDDYFSKPAAQARSTPEVGEFTKIFGKPAEPAAPGTPQPSSSPAGPSEYTRMMSAQPVAPPPTPAPAPAPVSKPPAASKNKSILPLILILSFLAVVALVLVFVFVRSH